MDKNRCHRFEVFGKIRHSAIWRPFTDSDPAASFLKPKQPIPVPNLPQPLKEIKILFFCFLFWVRVPPAKIAFKALLCVCISLQPLFLSILQQSNIRACRTVLAKKSRRNPAYNTQAVGRERCRRKKEAKGGKIQLKAIMIKRNGRGESLPKGFDSSGRLFNFEVDESKHPNRSPFSVRTISELGESYCSHFVVLSLHGCGDVTSKGFELWS